MKSIEVPLLYPNPLGGEFQESVGGKYHATEMFGTFVNADEALDRATTSVKTVNHSCMVSNLPMVAMDGDG